MISWEAEAQEKDRKARRFHHSHKLILATYSINPDSIALKRKTGTPDSIRLSLFYVISGSSATLRRALWPPRPNPPG